MTEQARTDIEPLSLTQIPLFSLIRLSKVFKEGELKYGRGNWRLGIKDKIFQLERANHALKHLLIYIHLLETDEYLGETKTLIHKMSDPSSDEHIREDDLAKVMWFCATQMELERLEKKEVKE